MIGMPPCPSHENSTITININLDDMMHPPIDPKMMMMKKMLLPEIMEAKKNACHELLGEKLASEMPSNGQTQSFMGDVCPESIPCPEMAIGSISEDLKKMLENLGPEDWDGEGFKKEKVEVYPEGSSFED